MAGQLKMKPWERPMGDFWCTFWTAGRKLGKGTLYVTRTPYPRAVDEDSPRIIFVAKDGIKFVIPSWRVRGWHKMNRHEFLFDCTGSNGGVYRAAVKLERGPDGRKGMTDDALNCMFHSFHRFGIQGMGWVDDGNGDWANVYFRNGRLVIPWLRGTEAEKIPEHWPWGSELHSEMKNGNSEKDFHAWCDREVLKRAASDWDNAAPQSPNGILGRIAHYARDRPGRELPAYPWADGKVTIKWLLKLGFSPQMVYPDIMGWINSTYISKMPEWGSEDPGGRVTGDRVQVPPIPSGRFYLPIWKYAGISDYKSLELYETVRFWWSRYTSGDWEYGNGLLPEPVKTGFDEAIKEIERVIKEKNQEYADYRTRMEGVPDPEGSTYVDSKGRPSWDGRTWSQEGACLRLPLRCMKRCLEITRSEASTFQYRKHAMNRFNELTGKLSELADRVWGHNSADPACYVMVNGRLDLNLATDIDEYMLPTRIVPEIKQAIADINRYRNGIPDPHPIDRSF